jgi:hypothetical protein
MELLLVPSKFGLQWITSKPTRATKRILFRATTKPKQIPGDNQTQTIPGDNQTQTIPGDNQTHTKNFLKPTEYNYAKYMYTTSMNQSSENETRDNDAHVQLDCSDETMLDNVGALDYSHALRDGIDNYDHVPLCEYVETRINLGPERRFLGRKDGLSFHDNLELCGPTRLSNADSPLLWSRISPFFDLL